MTGVAPDPLPTLSYRIVHRGWFADLDGAATVRLPAAECPHIMVTPDRGDISVVDEIRAGLAGSCS